MSGWIQATMQQNTISTPFYKPNFFLSETCQTNGIIFHTWHGNRFIMFSCKDFLPDSSEGFFTTLYTSSLRNNYILKFIYPQKATKFFEISTLDFTVCSTIKSKVEISQNFVAFRIPYELYDLS